MNAALPTIVLPTSEELKAWVEKQPEGSVIGLCRSAGKCMLAQYLQEQYPGLAISVSYYVENHKLVTTHLTVAYGREGADIDEQGRWEELEAPGLPAVLHRFDNVSFYRNPVTREQALSCFEESAHA